MTCKMLIPNPKTLNFRRLTCIFRPPPPVAARSIFWVCKSNLLSTPEALVTYSKIFTLACLRQTSLDFASRTCGISKFLRNFNEIHGRIWIFGFFSDFLSQRLRSNSNFIKVRSGAYFDEFSPSAKIPVPLAEN